MKRDNPIDIDPRLETVCPKWTPPSGAAPQEKLVRQGKPSLPRQSRLSWYSQLWFMARWEYDITQGDI